MRDIDKMIDEAIGAEERKLLDQIGRERGHFGQIADMFTTGPSAWMNVALMIAQSVLFIGGCYAAWEFYRATDPLTAMQWGLPAVAGILSSLIIKLSMWPSMHTNRIMRELKRIELQVALTNKAN
jgi:hypothetical protein